MNIRNAKISDLTAIVDIYNQSIPDRLATADTEAITVDSRLDWYKNRSPQRPLWVVESSNQESSCQESSCQIFGWLSFQNFYGRPAYEHTAEISIYVANEYHDRGIGSQLLAEAIAQSPQLQLTTLLAFVFAHNHPSLKLFKNYGFQQWGHLPDIAQLDNIARSLIILGRKIA